MDQWTGLLISFAVEVPVVTLVGWALRLLPLPDLPWLGLLALATTSLTAPAAFAVDSWTAGTVAIEARFTILLGLVIVLEGLTYAYVLRIGRRRALALSAVANGFSALALILFVALRAAP
jgi:hypothetical protein